MARHEHLPIYKAALDLCVYLEKIIRHFDRHHRYVIGADLRRLSTKAVMLIVKINDAHYKVPMLLELKDVLEEVKILIKVCKEVKAFNNFKSFAVSVKMTDGVLRQCAGWLKSQKKQSGRN
jgi:hypothetical protein